MREKTDEGRGEGVLDEARAPGIGDEEAEEVDEAEEATAEAAEIPTAALVDLSPLKVLLGSYRESETKAEAEVGSTRRQ